MFSATPSPLPAGPSKAVPARVSKRLVKELAHLQKDPPPNVAAWPVKDNAHKIHAQLCGPADSPYEGGIFRVELNIPETYPLDPPSASFLTPIYHPNVDERGRICLDTLSLPPKGCWSPALTLASLLTTLHQLLSYPNGQDGLVREVADVYNTDRHAFNARAKEWTRQHAMAEGAGEGAVRPQEGGVAIDVDTAQASECKQAESPEALECGKRPRAGEDSSVVLNSPGDSAESKAEVNPEGVRDGEVQPPDSKKSKVE